MLTKIEQFNLSQQKTDLPDIKPGDTVELFVEANNASINWRKVS